MNHQKLEPLSSELLERTRSARRVLMLTGVGMSVESGVPVFRNESAGLWARYSSKAAATKEGWCADLELVRVWYLRCTGIVNSTSPNAGREALARWAGLIGEGLSLQRLDIATQNIDDFHERVGLAVLAHLHGRLDRLYYIDCGLPGQSDLSMASRESVLRVTPSSCGSCGSNLRLSIMFFGEPLDGTDIDASVEAVQQADLTLVVGTFLIVYLAVALSGLAVRAGLFVVEVNPDPISLDYDLHWCTTAAVGLPQLVDQLAS